MTKTRDPFAHHPELKDRIACSESSFFRGFNLDDLVKAHPQLSDVRDWAHTDAEREAIRSAAVSGHSGDLWIFAYGSLMWDPALRFREVRRAHAAGYQRKLILKDDKGGRGTREHPGLMAALDEGTGCDGLAYRIAQADIEAETDILFRRELIGPGYTPAFIPVCLGDKTLSALTFLANHAFEEMQPNISRSDQVRCIASGSGVLGTSRDYLLNIVTQLTHLGIEDDDCTALLREVDAFMASNMDLKAVP